MRQELLLAYRVCGQLHHHGRAYVPGQVVELEENHAQGLLALGVVAPMEPVKPVELKAQPPAPQPGASQPVALQRTPLSDVSRPEGQAAPVLKTASATVSAQAKPAGSAPAVPAGRLIKKGPGHHGKGR